MSSKRTISAATGCAGTEGCARGAGDGVAVLASAAAHSIHSRHSAHSVASLSGLPSYVFSLEYELLSWKGAAVGAKEWPRLLVSRRPGSPCTVCREADVCKEADCVSNGVWLG